MCRERKIYRAIVGLTAMMAVSMFAFGQLETIDATARGTSTQLGRTINVKILINKFSTPDDRQVLKQAFQSGGNEKLVDALSKMKSVGRIRLPATVGYDLAYISSTPTPTGRKIRFAANRLIAFGGSCP